MKPVLKTTRYSGNHTFKIFTFLGNSGNGGGDGGGDGVLNSNHRGTGLGKTAGDLGERIPRGTDSSGSPWHPSFELIDLSNYGRNFWQCDLTCKTAHNSHECHH